MNRDCCRGRVFFPQSYGPGQNLLPLQITNLLSPFTVRPLRPSTPRLPARMRRPASSTTRPPTPTTRPSTPPPMTTVTGCAPATTGTTSTTARKCYERRVDARDCLSQPFPLQWMTTTKQNRKSQKKLRGSLRIVDESSVTLAQW